MLLMNSDDIIKRIMKVVENNFSSTDKLMFNFALKSLNEQLDNWHNLNNEEREEIKQSVRSIIALGVI